MSTTTGTIKSLLSEKGYGFIKPEPRGADVFFHVSGLVDRDEFNDLEIGTPVEFVLEIQGDRRRAVQVRIRK